MYKIPAMRETNSASAEGRITHCWRRCGFNAFFLTPDAPVPARYFQRHITLRVYPQASTTSNDQSPSGSEHRITDTHPSPCHLIERQELREHPQAAIAEPTPIRREVFRPYYVHQLSVKIIATRLKRSEGTIKSHLRNARLQLKERLTPHPKNQNIPWLA